MSERIQRLVTSPEIGAKSDEKFSDEITRNPASRLPYVVEKYRSAQMRQAVELEMVCES